VRGRYGTSPRNLGTIHGGAVRIQGNTSFRGVDAADGGHVSRETSPGSAARLTGDAPLTGPLLGRGQSHLPAAFETNRPGDQRSHDWPGRVASWERTSPWSPSLHASRLKGRGSAMKADHHRTVDTADVTVRESRRTRHLSGCSRESDRPLDEQCVLVTRRGTAAHRLLFHVKQRRSADGTHTRTSRPTRGPDSARLSPRSCREPDPATNPRHHR